MPILERQLPVSIAQLITFYVRLKQQKAKKVFVLELDVSLNLCV